MWKFKKFFRNESFQIYFWIWLNMYQNSNPQLIDCIVLLRNNDSKIEKRFAFEILNFESNAEPYVPLLL